ncbi:MAG: DMT family transporter [Firmicutes bacterium]|nr:DMT family transporter [Bacillota bacterium]MCM1400467.1 DMT family transporter [Bacteroides sp.]MCM1477438.1 DMT family transporter [Bacteroides sp.]
MESEVTLSAPQAAYPTKKQGHLALLLANVAWGVMSPISKSVLLQGQITPLALSAIRIGGSALLFLALSLILPASVAPRERIDRSDWGKLLLASILMISANQGLFILGIGFTNPIDSAVMSSTTPMLTMLLAAMVLGFPVTRAKLGGVVIGLAGVIMLVGGNESGEATPNPVLGDCLCLAAQICAAVYYVWLAGLTKKYAPFTLMKWMFFLSAVTYVPCCAPELVNVPWSAIGADTWLALGFIIVFATCLSYLALPFSQRVLKPTVVSVYNYLQPVLAAIMAVLLGVGEFGWLKFAATCLILLGVYFVNRGSR